MTPLVIPACLLTDKCQRLTAPLTETDELVTSLLNKPAGHLATYWSAN